MGVWIETSTLDSSSDDDASHPVWVCGLKLPNQDKISIPGSHTLYGCVD